ncbi:chemotaxis protein CheA [Dactylosporangium fulvum]|uniref:Chemotaxis protein CheA n=1 Tax=Dactylosporangium fulvum TaxID=53359 RepID=A0ABY5WA16_9ACTN|nr:chemotaxis protein CheA [Dactylosporangium fulvum]UWP86225.1 chemotaxis protein CheA [Dactylosporangium fulvum]
MNDDDIHDALETFITEARELVQDFEDGLLELESGPAGPEAVNGLFRAMHTLKGSAGLFGLGHLVSFAHVLESVLDELRGGRLQVTPELVSALLPCTDHITALVDGVAGGRTEPTAAEADVSARLLAALEPFQSGAPDGTAPPAAPAPDGPRTWLLSLWFGPDCLRNGMDPLSFLRYLSTMGTVAWAVTVRDALPRADEADPETCYLGFEVEFLSTAAKADIESVFEFVRDDSTITILPADSAVELIAALPENDRLGDLLRRSGMVTDLELAKALQIQQEAIRAGEASGKPLGEILVQEHIVQQPVVEAALDRQRKTAEGRQQDNQTIRVFASRLDKLIDLVGELVIAQAGVGTADGLSETQENVLRLVEEVRHTALSLRMVPIGTTLRRFERVVRDVCLDLGKEVDLVITGGEAEMDKALVERIGDPLLHLVRNALDHGMETRAERERLGKPVRGRLRLNAFHDAGSIVIEVADDGRGLDRERILAKAVDRGLVGRNAALTDHEVYALIFEPGFSTADTVSNLSGRGVGMDVVRGAITALRGSIDVQTTPGAGTTIQIRLPLTLAIIDGFLVGTGDAYFIIPLDRVTECVELPADADGRSFMHLREEVLPFVRLRQAFGLPGQPSRRQSVVVVEHSGQRAGIVVDHLIGQSQTVIKPLGNLFEDVRSVSGSTILGTGDVALILDIDALMAQHIAGDKLRRAAAARHQNRSNLVSSMSGTDTSADRAASAGTGR